MLQSPKRQSLIQTVCCFARKHSLETYVVHCISDSVAFIPVGVNHFLLRLSNVTRVRIHMERNEEERGREGANVFCVYFQIKDPENLLEDCMLSLWTNIVRVERTASAIIYDFIGFE